MVNRAFLCLQLKHSATSLRSGTTKYEYDGRSVVHAWIRFWPVVAIPRSISQRCALLSNIFERSSSTFTSRSLVLTNNPGPCLEQVRY
jgi:hypothetical protein